MYERHTTIAALSQFDGTEFAANHATGALRVHEILLSMGSESKTWTISKQWTTATGTASALLARSLTALGAAGAATDQYVAFYPDAPLYLPVGASISIVTTDATAAMEAQITYSVEGAS